MEVSEVPLESVFHLPSPCPVGRHTCAYSEKGSEVLMPPLRQRHDVSGRFPARPSRGAPHKQGLLWSSIGLAGGPPSACWHPCSLHPQHPPVSPKEQMAEWGEGVKGEWSL